MGGSTEELQKTTRSRNQEIPAFDGVIRKPLRIGNSPPLNTPSEGAGHWYGLVERVHIIVDEAMIITISAAVVLGA